MEGYNGLTHDGAEVSSTVDQDHGVAEVTYSGNGLCIKFGFNPDFPDDVKRFFLALCELRSIEVEC